jgi:hypothetical protein
VNRQAGKPPQLAAFLVRAANSRPLESVWQVAVPFAGVGVQQHPLEPDVVAQRYQRSGRPQTTSGSGALHPISPDQANGVPIEQQLTVHDASGRVYLPRQIALLESRYEPDRYADALREAPPTALADGVVWTVHVVFASAIDAPAT